MHRRGFPFCKTLSTARIEQGSVASLLRHTPHNTAIKLLKEAPIAVLARVFTFFFFFFYCAQLFQRVNVTSGNCDRVFAICATCHCWLNAVYKREKEKGENNDSAQKAKVYFNRFGSLRSPRYVYSFSHYY